MRSQERAVAGLLLLRSFLFTCLLLLLYLAQAFISRASQTVPTPFSHTHTLSLRFFPSIPARLLLLPPRVPGCPASSAPHTCFHIEVPACLPPLGLTVTVVTTDPCRAAAPAGDPLASTLQSYWW